MGSGGAAWVFHAGALGDFVMTWPLLRALRAAGWGVTVVAPGEKAQLAAAELGVVGVGAEARRFTRIWIGGDVDESEVVPGVERVLTFAADPATEGGARWCAGAAAMFPGAEVVYVGPPGTSSRERVWRWADVERMGGVTPREDRGGPVVAHVGAGSREKQWPMERWRGLVHALREGGRGVRVLAGEVEVERMTGEDRRVFTGAGGEFCTQLSELADVLRGASLMIGCDTGPTHLAAQLGVATVALFGPTDPGVWAPRGPRVCVVAPDERAPMSWLSMDRALRAAALV